MASLIEMAEAPAPEMAQAPAESPRIIHDLERIFFRIVYGIVSNFGVEESDKYLKQIANEIYIYLRQTQTYDKYGETTNPEFDKGLYYEHVAGTDEALDGHLDKTFDIFGLVCDTTRWDNLYKCSLCNKRRFCRKQNLTRHLIWHSYPVVSKAPNDDDELNFEATHEWLCQFKKNYLWPVQIHRNLEHGMPSPNGSSVDSSDNE